MTVPALERARARKPVTWLTLLGILLLPVVIGGILVAALYNPTERLDQMTAAVVNNDDPVTIDGQYIPLGRQLTAGLVDGSDDAPSNLSWSISNTEDARAGLTEGRYDAVVTIPAGFSAAATSTAPGKTPTTATIQVTTPPDSLIVDDAITSQLAQTAAAVMGQQLSTVYLENVFLGFTTLGDRLGDAADGAHTWADGAGQAATGARTWADGASEAAGGGTTLADGVRSLAGGASGIASGAQGLSSGATQVADGTAQLAAGTTATADGLDRWAAGAGTLSQGTRSLAGGLQQIADQVSQIPAVPQEIVDGAAAIAARSGEIKSAVSDASDQISQAAATCAENGGSEQLCAALTQIAERTSAALPEINGVIDQSGTVADQVGQLAQLGPQLTAGLQQSATAAGSLAGGMDELAQGATDTAGGARQLADGMNGAAGGARQLADGARQLADGTAPFVSGANQAASGADTLAAGLGELATGAGGLSDGVDSLAGGATTLADGLTQASDSLPSYTDKEANSLASVVSDPVVADGGSSSLFGASAVPLLATIALWFGALASFVALQATPRRALSSRRSSAMLALSNLWPAAAIGAGQGLLVAGVVQFAAHYDAPRWFAFAGLSILIGVVFAAVNQALVTVLGGAGRWISALVGVLAVATGIVSTVPGVLAQLGALLPPMPAYRALLGAISDAGGVGAACAGLIVWGILALVASVVAVSRQRSVSTRALLAAPTPA